MATALLVGWLFFVVARVTIGDVRFPRIHVGSLQSLSGGAPAISPPNNGASGEPVSTSADEAEQPEEPPEPPQDHDEADVEQAVYNRLYGQRGRRD